MLTEAIHNEAVKAAEQATANFLTKHNGQFYGLVHTTKVTPNLVRALPSKDSRNPTVVVTNCGIQVVILRKTSPLKKQVLTLTLPQLKNICLA